LALLSALLGACVGPARTEDAYRGKAVATAEAMVSAVETGRLAATQGSAGKLWAPTLSVIVAEAEADAVSIEGQFASIQPPSVSADRVRGQVTPLLGQAVDRLAELRISARRGDLEQVSALARTLNPLARALRSFIDANNPP